MQKKFGIATIAIGALSVIFSLICFCSTGTGDYRTPGYVFDGYYNYNANEANLMYAAKNVSNLIDLLGTGLGFVLLIAGAMLILSGIKQIVCENVASVMPKEVKRCLNCGKEIKGSEKFCTSCGTAIEENNSNSYSNEKTFENTQVLKTKYCAKCGKEINVDAVICVHCGCSVDKTTKTSTGRNSSNDNLFRFLLTFFLGWIGSIVINCTALKPAGFKSRTLAYVFLTAITFGIYGLVASLCNLGFDPNKERNIGYKRTNE